MSLVLFFRQQSDCSSLRQCLNNKYSRHYLLLWKMSYKMHFIGRYAFNTTSLLSRLTLRYPVY